MFLIKINFRIVEHHSLLFGTHDNQPETYSSTAVLAPLRRSVLLINSRSYLFNTAANIDNTVTVNLGAIPAESTDLVPPRSCHFNPVKIAKIFTFRSNNN